MFKSGYWSVKYKIKGKIVIKSVSLKKISVLEEDEDGHFGKLALVRAASQRMWELSLCLMG